MGNELQVFNNDKLKLKVRTITFKDGTISINAEDTAIGFGWVQTKNGKEYPRWETLNAYISDFGFSQQVGKEDFIPESLFYMLGMKASNKVAQEFQKWLAVEVIPSIRKNGSYIADFKQQEKMFNVMKMEITGLVDEIISEKINQIEDKCSQYFRPVSKEKQNIVQYIKKRLGIEKTNEEYELVKQRVLIKLGGEKWEDIPIEALVNSLNIIDESIRVIKADRVNNQVSFFEAACIKQ